MPLGNRDNKMGFVPTLLLQFRSANKEKRRKILDVTTRDRMKCIEKMCYKFGRKSAGIGAVWDKVSLISHLFVLYSRECFNQKVQLYP